MLGPAGAACRPLACASETKAPQSMVSPEHDHIFRGDFAIADELEHSSNFRGGKRAQGKVAAQFVKSHVVDAHDVRCLSSQHLRPPPAASKACEVVVVMVWAPAAQEEEEFLLWSSRAATAAEH